MLLVPALATIALTQQTPSAPPQHFTSKIAGQEIRWNLAPTPRQAMPDEVLRWDGWGFLADEGRSADWNVRLAFPAGLQEEYVKARAKITDQTPAWRTKVFIIRRVDNLYSGHLLTLHRTSFDGKDFPALLVGLAQYSALAEIESEGSVRMDLNAEIDDEPARIDYVDGRAAPARDRGVLPWAEEYLRARINGPGFKSDDGVDQGPFSNVLLLIPGNSTTVAATGVVNRTPFAVVRVRGGFSVESPEVAYAAAEAWNAALGAPRQDAATGGAPSNGGVSARELAPIVAQSSEPNTDRYLRLLASGAPHPRFTISQQKLPLYAGPVSLSIANDSERGSVLKYAETSILRAGGALSPRGQLADAKGKYLSFWVKSSHRDPVHVSAFSGGPQAKGLGSAVLSEKSYADARTASFVPNGTWQRVVIELEEQPTAPLTLALVSYRQMAYPERHTLGTIEYFFDDFQLSAEPPAPVKQAPPYAPNLDSDSEIERAMALRRISEDSPKEQTAKAVKLLSDKSELVRLNAADALTRVKVAGAAAELSGRVNDISQFVAQRMLMALHFQDPQAAMPVLRRTLELGPSDAARETAAELLAETKDPRLGGVISITIARRSRALKLSAIRSLALMPGEQAATLLAVFFNQNDPEVRLLATEHANVTYATVRKQVMYNAVNDPSDAVRAASYIKLLSSADPAVRAEGAKGVRDDGVLVRSAVVRHLGKTANEEFRQSLRLAVLDQAASVRAEALRAFATMPKGVAFNEIENALSDDHPLVQSALLDLAAARNLKLPAATVSAMKKSPLRSIAERAALAG